MSTDPVKTGRARRAAIKSEIKRLRAVIREERRVRNAELRVAAGNYERACAQANRMQRAYDRLSARNIKPGPAERAATRRLAILETR